MRMRTAMMPLLLLSAVCTGPAFANYFSDPRTGTMLNIGSAPNPTASDIQATQQDRMGFPDVRLQSLYSMQGKAAFGAHGQRLGEIVSVNPKLETVTLATRYGARLWFPAADFAVSPYGVHTDMWRLANNGRIVSTTLALNR